jgi:hypothetical protein
MPSANESSSLIAAVSAQTCMFVFLSRNDSCMPSLRICRNCERCNNARVQDDCVQDDCVQDDCVQDDCVQDDCVQLPRICHNDEKTVETGFKSTVPLKIYCADDLLCQYLVQK